MSNVMNMKSNSAECVSLICQAKYEPYAFPQRFLNYSRVKTETYLVDLDKPIYDYQNAVLDELKEHIEFDSDTALCLKSNFYVCEALLGVLEHLPNYFKQDYLSLEKDDEENFWLYIYVSETPRTALEQLWNFDKGWWLNNKKSAKDKLHIDVVPL